VRVSLGNAVVNLRSGYITIGDYSMLGHNVMLLTGYHDIYEFPEDRRRRTVEDAERSITIGKGVFIGSGAIIIGKVSIGDYAVVGAGAVVVKDVPRYTFVAGNPAKEIRRLL
jgi:acetyltransferase-like isoleucine patch superfamily enzyme